ncbi:unnamed protein product, partial [Ectocarpus sp. 4 AP-2014]
MIQCSPPGYTRWLCDSLVDSICGAPTAVFVRGTYTILRRAWNISGISMRLARTPRRSFSLQGGRRGRVSMASYQALFALCMGAGFFIVCMHWHHEVQNLPMENIPAGQPPKA